MFEASIDGEMYDPDRWIEYLRLSVGLMLCRPNPADFLEAKSTLAQSKMTWV